MEKRVALVTGGTGGIGTAICRELSSKGIEVVASYYKNGDHEAAKHWQQQQSTLGYKIDINYANVANYKESETLIKQITEKYGKIDIVINNAGLTADSCFKKMTLEQWDNVLQTNLNGLFNITRNVINGMLQNQFGRIVSISSINGQKGQFGQCNYAATKSAIYGFTKSLALEVASKGITVNSISPGYIKTDMLSSVNEDVMRQIVANIPVGRLGTPEEIARMAAFLVDDASGFITGANFSVNGGQYM